MICSIDWNVTCSYRRRDVKRSVEERELTVMLVVDILGSLRMRDRTHQSKRYHRRVRCAAGISSHRQQRQGWLVAVPEKTLSCSFRRAKVMACAARAARAVLSRAQLTQKSLWYRRWLQFRRRNVDNRRTDIGGVFTLSPCAARKSVLSVLSDFIDAGYLPTLAQC